MSGSRTTVTEVARSFSDFINRVAYRQESFVLTKGNKPVAELRPVPTGRRLGDISSILRSFPRLAEGDAKAFADDVDTARACMPANEGTDPWAS